MCKVEATRLRGYIIKYSVDVGTGLIKPIIRRATHVRISGGEFTVLNPMDCILFTSKDLNMKNSCSVNAIHASQLFPMVGVGSMVSFVVRLGLPFQRNIHTGNLAAENVMLEKTKSPLSLQTPAGPDFQEWIMSMKKINTMILSAHEDFCEGRGSDFTVNTVDGIPMNF